MGRIKQQRSSRGSQRWIQELVDNYPDTLEKAINIGHIDWLSPRADREYAEYRDEAFLELLEIKPSKRSLSSFLSPRVFQLHRL
jgi:hypothetical protein